MKPAPVACCLTLAELREREAWLLARLRPAVTALPYGYAFTFEGDGKWLVLAAEVMAAERECCPFPTFEIVAQPDHGALFHKDHRPGAQQGLPDDDPGRTGNHGVGTCTPGKAVG